MSRKIVNRDTVDKATFRRWLEEKTMLQKELVVAVSRRLAIKPPLVESWISQILHGHTRLGIDQAIAIAAILEKPLEDVLAVFGVRGALSRGRKR